MGIIFNIQEYSVNDGDGIRTTIFLKGCPLACIWCSNPEGNNSHIELLHNKELCRKCSECMNSCPYRAVSIDETAGSEGFPVFDRKKCNECEEKTCVSNCLHNGLKTSGDIITPELLFEKIKTNSLFFAKSGGGITFSGGEPLIQADFVNRVLELCERNGISAGVETCGMFDWEKVKHLAHKFEFIYFDIKCVTPEIHKKYTGAGNSTILNNLKRISSSLKDIITLSVPVIPEFNDNENEMKKIADLCLECGITKARLLPYHSLGQSKYSMLGVEYKMPGNVSVPGGFINSAVDIFKSKGIHCTIDSF